MHPTTPYANILEDDTKLNTCQEFITANKFDTIVLYNLHQITNSPSKDNLLLRLKMFIDQLKSNGVEQIGFAVGGSRCIQNIKSFCKQYSVKIDVVVTEYEFWNGGVYTYHGYMSILNELQTLKQESENTLKICTYIGNINRHSEKSSKFIKDIAGLVDAMFVECYAADLKRTARKYIQRTSDVPADIDVYLICSAEGKCFAAGSEYFLGDYISNQSLDNIHSDIIDLLDTKQCVTSIKGIVFYSYAYLHFHLNKKKLINA